MTVADGSSGADSAFSDYLRVILRRKWIVIALVVIAAVAAFAVSSSKQALYQGNAEMILTQQDILNSVTGQPSPPDAATADRNVQTMSTLARVPLVAQKTLARAGVHSLTASQLLANSSVTPSSDADVLTFSVTDPDQNLASRLATSYAQQFQQYQHRLNVTSLNQAQDKVNHELRRLGHAASHSALYGYLIGKSEQLQSLQTLESSNNYVVHPAAAATQVQPRPLRDSMLAVVVGLLLGVALAFLVETLDSRVKNVEEIRGILGLRVLARIPAFRRRQEQMVMLRDPQSPQAEAFRTLRTNLDLANAHRELKTLMIVSAQHEDGKSTTVANLAVALARAGRTVVVVDCDLHHPALHRLLRVRAPRGLQQVLAGDVPIERVLTPVEIGRPTTSEGASGSNGSGTVTGVVEVLPGANGQLGDGLLGERISEVLRELEPRFDYVLVDTPPLLEFGDALSLSAHVDGVLVVARVKGTKRGALEELQQVLAALPALPIGIVATGTDSAAGAYYSPEPPLERLRSVQFRRTPAK
jgi:Mrp family chromosome partitioning ATPase/capsular polysaccharide biosynthesis protein